MDDLIRRLNNTVSGVGEYGIATDGTSHKNEKLTREDAEKVIEYLNQIAEVQEAVDELDATYRDEQDLKKFAKRMFIIFGKDKDLEHQNPCIDCPDKRGPDPSRSPFDDGCYPCNKAEVYDRKVDLFRIHGWLPWLYPGDDKEKE